MKWEVYHAESDVCNYIELKENEQYNDQIIFNKLIEINLLNDIENIETEPYNHCVYIWNKPLNLILYTILKGDIFLPM